MAYTSLWYITPDQYMCYYVTQIKRHGLILENYERIQDIYVGLIRNRLEYTFKENGICLQAHVCVIVIFPKGDVVVRLESTLNYLR